jgi:hypothetical protein
MSLAHVLNSFFPPINRSLVHGVPAFDPQKLLSGPINAWGIIQDRRGNVTSYFSIKMLGTWNDNHGTLEEEFHYKNTGEIQKRCWNIHKKDDLLYKGTADDVPGGAEGIVYGNSMKWTYQMDIKVNNHSYRMNFEDWMWAIDEHTIMDKIAIRKFGITFAQITLLMRRQEKTS